MMTTRLNDPLRRCTAHLLVSAIAVALIGCAHSSSTPDSMPAKEAAAMTTQESASTSDNPGLTAEEIGKRFLKLVERLTPQEDLSLERVQEMTGLDLVPAVSGGFYGVEGDLGDGWKYVFNFYPESPSMAAGVELHFEKAGERFGDMTPVCGFGFDHYHNALKAMGFVDNPMYGEIGQLESWRYTKFSKLDGSAEIEVSIIPHNVIPGETGPLCVKLISTLN